MEKKYLKTWQIEKKKKKRNKCTPSKISWVNSKEKMHQSGLYQKDNVRMTLSHLSRVSCVYFGSNWNRCHDAAEADALIVYKNSGDQAGEPGWGDRNPQVCSYHRTLLQVCVAPRGEPATMGTWMGLCCLLVTKSSFSSNDLQVASRACSLASMLSNRKHIVWLIEYRNDWKWKKEKLQKE